MPQLDIGSYRSQVNTLVRRFGRRYRTRTGWVLPKLGRAVKRRAKKAEQGRREGESMGEVRSQSEEGHGKRMGEARNLGASALEEAQQQQRNWLRGAKAEKRTSLK